MDIFWLESWMVVQDVRLTPARGKMIDYLFHTYPSAFYYWFSRQHDGVQFNPIRKHGHASQRLSRDPDCPFVGITISSIQYHLWRIDLMTFSIIDRQP